MLIQTGTFIKAAEAKNGDIITLLDAGEVRESTQFTVKLKDGKEIPKKDYVFKIAHNGTEKVLSMNKMSRENLATAYTNNTENWIGKKASIEMCLFSNGKRGIVLSPIVDVNEHDEEPPVQDGPDSAPF